MNSGQAVNEMHRVGYFLTSGFQVMAIGTQTVFEMANVVSREQIYDVTNYSLAGGAIRSSLGLSVTTEKVTAGTVADSWMIGGVVNPLMKETPADELAFIRHASLHSRRTAGLC